MRVNLSARQLAQADLIEIVDAALQRAGMAAEQLCLEVTESVLVEDPEACARTLAGLRRSV